MPSEVPPEDCERRGLTPAVHHQTLYPVPKLSVGASSSVDMSFEHNPASLPEDENIIIVVVRLSGKQRRNPFGDPLPDRPPARGFFRRMSTRVLTRPSSDRWKTVKMPQSDYDRYFRHDAQGRYVGTGPVREWDEAEIMEKYGHYQNLPLRSIFGRTTEDHVPFPLAWGA